MVTLLTAVTQCCSAVCLAAPPNAVSSCVRLSICFICSSQVHVEMDSHSHDLMDNTHSRVCFRAIPIDRMWIAVKKQDAEMPRRYKACDERDRVASSVAERLGVRGHAHLLGAQAAASSAQGCQGVRASRYQGIHVYRSTKLTARSLSRYHDCAKLKSKRACKES
jgi:hypothetical protein